MLQVDLVVGRIVPRLTGAVAEQQVYGAAHYIHARRRYKHHSPGRLGGLKKKKKKIIEHFLPDKPFVERREFHGGKAHILQTRKTRISYKREFSTKNNVLAQKLNDTRQSTAGRRISVIYSLGREFTVTSFRPKSGWISLTRRINMSANFILQKTRKTLLGNKTERDLFEKQQVSKSIKCF